MSSADILNGAGEESRSWSSSILDTEGEPRWSFDLTEFPSRSAFQDLLDRHGLTEYKRIDRDPEDDDPWYAYVWYRPDRSLVIQCSNNPISGKHSQPRTRSPDRGYASYVAVEGKPAKAAQLAADIAASASHVKAGGRGFGHCRIGDQVRSALDLPAERKLASFLADDEGDRQ